tara:strand:- start:2454 stop:6368 length:3915 start_codon:yes stop_codon:yes gene_type:complete
MASNILKFHPSNLITGINIVDDMLLFTDGVNEPKKIDLNIFRAADHSSGNTVVYGRDFQERDITVIRPHPQTAIKTVVSGSTDMLDPIANVPEVTTEPATGIKGIGGAVTLRGTSKSGSLPFTSRGFYYVQSDTDINDKDIIKATGTLVNSHINGFDFEAEVTGLTLTKRYYYIAWAENNVGNKKIFATDTLGQDDIESFIVQDIANDPGGPQINLKTEEVTNHVRIDGKVVLGCTVNSGVSLSFKGFFVYRTQNTDTQDFATDAGNLKTLVFNLSGNKSVEEYTTNEFRNFRPTGKNQQYEINLAGKIFSTTLDITPDDKIFVQAFGGTGQSNAIEEVGNIVKYPNPTSGDPNLKSKAALPDPEFQLPFDQNGTSVVMKAKLDATKWYSNDRRERGFYFSKKLFTVQTVTDLLASSNGFGTVTPVDIPIADNFIDIEWSRAVDNPDIYRAKTLWERAGYMGDIQQFDLDTSNIAGFTLTKDETIYVMPFGVTNHGEGYARINPVRKFKAGASDPKVPVTITSHKIEFIQGKIQVDFTIAFEQGLIDANKPIRAGVYFTSQDVGISLGNGSNANKQGLILQRSKGRGGSNNRIARALYTADINNKAIVNASGKVETGKFQVQYGADITATNPGVGVARVSSTLPMERKEYYAMPFVEFDGKDDVFGYVLGPPKLGRINDPPQFRTLKATDITITNNQPVATLNAELVAQLSNTPTLTEAGFIYATANASDPNAQKAAADSVAAGTASSLVAVSGTVTSNFPNSISLLNSFLGSQGTAGQTPEFRAQKTFTGEHGKLLFYVAYVKLSGTGTTLHLAETDNQPGDYGKGVVRIKLPGTSSNTSGTGTRLPVPELEPNPQPTTAFGCTFVAKEGDNGGSNKRLVNMTPKFYYMRKLDVPPQNQATEAAIQAYIRINCNTNANANSGIITVNATNDLSVQDNIVSVKMGEGSNPKLAANTRYFYFVTSNNGFSATTNGFATGEGPSVNVFQFRTDPPPDPFDKSDHSGHTCRPTCRAFPSIIKIDNITESTADVEVKWSGGGGTKNFEKHGVFLLKTSDMITPHGTKNYMASHLLLATNPSPTFINSASGVYDTLTLTGLEKATSYQILALLKNDNTITDLPTYNNYFHTGNTGLATLPISVAGVSLAGVGLDFWKDGFTTKGAVTKPLPAIEISASPSSIYLNRNGGMRKQALVGGPHVTGSAPVVSIKVTLSPSDAILKESHISFPGANLHDSPIQLTVPGSGGKKVVIRKSGTGRFVIDLKFAGFMPQRFQNAQGVQIKKSILQIDHPMGKGVSKKIQIFQDSND